MVVKCYLAADHWRISMPQNDEDTMDMVVKCYLAADHWRISMPQNDEDTMDMVVKCYLAADHWRIRMPQKDEDTMDMVGNIFPFNEHPTTTCYILLFIMSCCRLPLTCKERGILHTRGTMCMGNGERL